MSGTDDRLDELGAIEREYDDDFPHAWEDVVRGTRTAQEVAAERLEAGDDPDEVQQLARSLRRLDDAARDVWVDRLAEVIATASPDPKADTDASTDARVVSLDQRRGRGPWVAVVLGALVAAALVLWLVPRDGRGPTPPGEGVALPGFELLVRNETVHDVRSSDDPVAIPRYRADTAVHWVIRPEHSAPASLRIAVLAEADDPTAPRPRRWIVPAGVTVTDRGVIELRGTFASIFALPPGRWSLQVVVGESVPTELAAYDRGGPWTRVEPAYVIDVIQ